MDVVDCNLGRLRSSRSTQFIVNECAGEHEHEQCIERFRVPGSQGCFGLMDFAWWMAPLLDILPSSIALMLFQALKPGLRPLSWITYHEIALTPWAAPRTVPHFAAFP
jgi:hypothetical protein